MKATTVSVVFAVLLPACSLIDSGDNTDEVEQTAPPTLVQVHLQERFSNDPIQVSVDDQVVFVGTVTSWNGLAARFDSHVKPGAHTLRVEVWDERLNVKQGSHPFSLSDTLYIGVRKSEADEFAFEESEFSFVYL